MLGISASVLADWTKVAAYPGEDIYTDKSRNRTEGNTPRVWLLHDKKQKAKTLDGKSYLSNINQLDLNCVEESFRARYMAFYSTPMGMGKVVDTNSYGDSALWNPIPPSSIIEDIWKSLCK